MSGRPSGQLEYAHEYLPSIGPDDILDDNYGCSYTQRYEPHEPWVNESNQSQVQSNVIVPMHPTIFVCLLSLGH